MSKNRLNGERECVGGCVFVSASVWVCVRETECMRDRLPSTTVGGREGGVGSLTCSMLTRHPAMFLAIDAERYTRTSAFMCVMYVQSVWGDAQDVSTPEER